MKIRLIALIVSAAVTLGVFGVSFAIGKVVEEDSQENITLNNQSSNNNTSSEVSSTESETVTSSETESIVNSSEATSSIGSSSVTSSKNNSSSSTNSTTSTGTDTSHLFPGYQYNNVFDIEDNVFLDALTYTGYNLQKHRDDGEMWNYILSKDKAHRGWLSKITFGGGSTGLETTDDGLPNIKKFEKGGLVCASFASYVYFNYLPNIAKIDTSSLALPEDTKTAQSFYQAAKKWVENGQSYNIGFKATNKAAGIQFEPEEEIPIGSIIVFRDLDKPGRTQADHITIYVGEKNGYHWVIQTGNKNGPEFCAVERFKFGPYPQQWPLNIFATPTCIYDAAGAKAQAESN